MKKLSIRTVHSKESGKMHMDFFIEKMDPPLFVIVQTALLVRSLSILNLDFTENWALLKSGTIKTAQSSLKGFISIESISEMRKKVSGVFGEYFPMKNDKALRY
jgi:hypothetical protein